MSRILQDLTDYRNQVGAELKKAYGLCDEFYIMYMQPVYDKLDKIIKDIDGPCTCELHHAFEDVLDEVFGVLVCLSNVISKSEGNIEPKRLVPIQKMLNSILFKYDQMEFEY